MYVRVPEHLKEPLLRELRQLRLRSSFKHYPTLVLIFSCIAALFVFLKGHPIVHMFRDIIPTAVSDARLITLVLLAIVLTTAAIMVYFLRQVYKECECQECLYCPKCDAVDKYDSGICPICQAPLVNKDSFYFTTYKDEQKIIQKWGLHPSREE